MNRSKTSDRGLTVAAMAVSFASIVSLALRFGLPSVGIDGALWTIGLPAVVATSGIVVAAKALFPGAPSR